MGRDQVPFDELEEVVQPAGRGRLDGEAPDGQEVVDGIGRSGQRGGDERREGEEKETSHRFVVLSSTKITIFPEFRRVGRKGIKFAATCTSKNPKTMMKRILFLAIAALLMTACAFSLPGKFTQLADKVAAKGADFTPKQWEKANAQFEKLVQQYVDKYDKLSKEDKKEINAAIGKYTATALKCGVADGLKQINALLKQVPSSIDTAVEGAKGFLEELGL